MTMISPTGARLLLLRWQLRLDATPFSLFLSAGAIPIGLVAAVVGSEVSAAISRVLPGAVIPHAWGGLLFLGGVSTLTAILCAAWLWEYVGLRLMAFALVFYSACCYTGLGLGGVVSGTFALCYALACWYRSRFLFRQMKASVPAQRPDGGNDA